MFDRKKTGQYETDSSAFSSNLIGYYACSGVCSFCFYSFCGITVAIVFVGISSIHSTLVISQSVIGICLNQIPEKCFQIENFAKSCDVFMNIIFCIKSCGICRNYVAIVV